MPDSKLPSTLGPVEFTRDNVRLWAANASRFAPIIHAGTPWQSTIGDCISIAPSPSTSFIPREYQIHLHSQLCANCGTGSEWTLTYALELSTSRMGQRTYEHLRSVDRFSYNVPTRVIRTPVKRVPACQECAKTNLSLSHLPSPPSNTAIANGIAAASPPAPTTKKRPLTVKDLL